MSLPIEIVVYPQGAARCVVDLDNLIDLLSSDQRAYLTDKLLARLVADIKELSDDIERLTH